MRFEHVDSVIKDLENENEYVSGLYVSEARRETRYVRTRVVVDEVALEEVLLI